MSAFQVVSFLPKHGEDRGLLAGVIGVMVFLSSLAAIVGIYLGDITRSVSAEMASGLSVQIVAADRSEREREVAASMEKYGALLREIGRSAEANEMEARAKMIRAKHAEENPAN